MPGTKLRARRMAALMRGVVEEVESWTQLDLDNGEPCEVLVIRVDPKGRAHLLDGLGGKISAVWGFGPHYDPPAAMLNIGVTSPAATIFKLPFLLEGEDIRQLERIAERGLLGITCSARGAPGGKTYLVRVPVDDLREFLGANR